MKVLFGVLLLASIFIMPFVVFIWFIDAVISLKKTSKEDDKIIYAKRRANFIAASVVFGIIAAIVFMIFYLSFSNFSLM